MQNIILASGSPRRKEYLSYLGLPFSIEVPDIDETPLEGETPSNLVYRLSKLKAQTISKNHINDIVIAADTVVALGNTILGKPENRDDAFNMIKLLQGKTHEVYTGTTVQKNNEIKSFVMVTKVTFDSLDDDLIKTYVASGESDDKSGSYALQGIASTLISKVEGSVSTVVGLPINEVRKALKDFGIEPNTVKVQ
jgi:septum formation protein